jgi:hypothetical protein
MYKVGDLVYYVNKTEDIKKYCIIKRIENDEGQYKIWGKWTSNLLNVNNVNYYEGWMPIEEVFLEKSIKKEIKVYGISKFMDKINKRSVNG